MDMAAEAKTIVGKLLYIIGILACTGCASGFNRSQMQAALRGQEAPGQAYQVQVDRPPAQVTAKDLKKALGLKPQLHFPFKLAVYLTADSLKGEWRWTTKDREQIQTWGDTLKKRGIVSDLFVMSDLVVKDVALPELRLAAAKYGADAVLLIKGIGDVDSYVNPMSLLYLTIVGYYFIPGSQIDGLVMLRGAMWDVGNEYLYLTVESEGQHESFGPGAFIHAKDTLESAKHQALKDLGKELVERATGLR